MTSRITYDDARHAYRLDGERVPSVTRITGALDKPGLSYAMGREAGIWGAGNAELVDSLGGLVPFGQAAVKAVQAQWRESATIGSQVHKLAEQLVYGHELPAEDSDGLPWSEPVWTRAEQLARFFDAWAVEPVAHELIVFSEQHRYAGRLDLIATLRDGQRWLLDYKTGSGVYPETGLQLAAYRYASHYALADRDMLLPEVDACGAVWLGPDFAHLLPVRADRAVHSVFLACMPLQRWGATPRNRIVGEALVPA